MFFKNQNFKADPLTPRRPSQIPTVSGAAGSKAISQQTELLSWKHSGFHIDGGEKPVAPDDPEGRQRLAEYLLRAPFSLQKIHWNPKTHTVLYRSRRSWKTKRNFEVFKATDFLAAAIDHIPPRGQQTIRYYGLYSNKSRGLPRRNTLEVEPIVEKQPAQEPPIVPPPPKVTAFGDDSWWQKRSGGASQL